MATLFSKPNLPFLFHMPRWPEGGRGEGGVHFQGQLTFITDTFQKSIQKEHFYSFLRLFAITFLSSSIDLRCIDFYDFSASDPLFKIQDPSKVKRVYTFRASDGTSKDSKRLQHQSHKSILTHLYLMGENMNDC